MDNRLLLALGGTMMLAAGYLASQTETGQQISEEIMSGIKSMVQDISDSGKSFIKNIEGLSLKAYKDAGGYSIGYGHYMGKAPTMTTVTTAQADSLFDGDIRPVVNAVKKYIKVPLTQNQFDALCSFVYNLGVNVLANATLTKVLNSGDYLGAADEFKKWVYSQGVINSSLVARRQAEKQLFLS